MEVVFIIGNGFDINLGMKTRYSDFFTYYQSVESSSEAVNKLKKEISKDFHNWSDLELALGRYTEKTQTFAEFEEAFEDIGEELAKYLQKEEDDFDFDMVDYKELFNYLCFPEQSLLPLDRIKIEAFKNSLNQGQSNSYIITFNYTKALEKILIEKYRGIIIGNINNYSNVLQSIEHIHGYVNNRMIMGVNDTTQVANSLFHENQDFLETFVKGDCNHANKHEIDVFCLNQISNANLICIFGSSLGDTDNMWWNIISATLLESNCRLIIFYRDKDITERLSHKKARIERKIKETFLKKIEMSEKDKEIIAAKIFIGINTKIFDFNIEKLKF